MSQAAVLWEQRGERSNGRPPGSVLQFDHTGSTSRGPRYPPEAQSEPGMRCDVRERHELLGSSPFESKLLL